MESQKEAKTVTKMESQKEAKTVQIRAAIEGITKHVGKSVRAPGAGEVLFCLLTLKAYVDEPKLDVAVAELSSLKPGYELPYSPTLADVTSSPKIIALLRY